MVYSEVARVLLSTLRRRVLFHSAKCKSAPTLGQGLFGPPPNPTAGTAQPNTTQSARSGNMCYTKTQRQFRRPLNRPRQVRVITTQLRSSVPVSLLYSTTCVSVLCVTEHMYTSHRKSQLARGSFQRRPFSYRVQGDGCVWFCSGTRERCDDAAYQVLLSPDPCELQEV